MAITKDRIFEVAEAMDAAGQVPTLARSQGLEQPTPRGFSDDAIILGDDD